MKMFDNNFTNPPKHKLNTLLEYYKTGRFDDAEKLSLSITQEFPGHNYAWKALGSIFNQKGKFNESLVAFQKSVELAPWDAEAHKNLATILKYLGRLDEAETSYRQAIVLKPEYSEAYNDLGATLSELGRLDEAETSYRQAIELKPNSPQAHHNLGLVLKNLERLKEAEISFKKAIEFKPDYEEAKHLLSALTGQTTNSAPREYVENLFDNYAINFENSLINKLEYKTPNLITEFIVAKNPNIQLGSVLDLGCGTGLIGDEIKKYCSNLEGVDLSKSMLEKASAKNIYDKLEHKDIIEYLSTEDLDFNYFISADVLIYVGELSEIFKLIKSRNKLKGKFIFSTEHTDRDGFFLEQTGRYSHSLKYIESLCNKFGYKLSHFEKTNLRKDKDKFIIGGLYFLDF
jgi:predicted TPR repeat methyltransferase